MEGLCNFYADRENPFTRNLFPFRPESTHVDISEVTFSERQQTHEVRSIGIPHAELDAWLSKNQTAGTQGSLRVVWVTRHQDANAWSYGIRKSDLEKVLKCFRIEKAFHYGYTGEAGIADFSDGHGKENIHTYSVFVSNFLGLAWAYNANSGTTQAVCWGDPWITSQMKRLITHQKSLCSHPTALELFTAVVLEERIDRDLLRKIHEIRRVEIRTGYQGWTTVETTPAEGDYAALSAMMSGCAVTLVGIKRIGRIIDELLRCHSNFPEHQSIYTNNSPDQNVQLVIASMRECEKTLKMRLVMQEVQVDWLLQRAQIQQAALFNLIAQKDAKLNITLAKDSRTLATASKRDSSSMKTLAAVTVAFLPATFVASFFAMPLFNWDAEKSSSVVNERFWIYWAVTVPLTLTTLVIWLSWTHRQTLLHRAQERRDRDQLIYDIAGDEKVEEDREDDDSQSRELV